MSYAYFWPFKPEAAAEFEEIEDFESGSEGAGYSTSSGIADGGSGTATETYTVNAAAEGSFGLRTVSPSGTELFNRYISITGGNTGQQYAFFAVRGSVPDAVITIAQIRDASNQLVVIRLDTTGAFILRDDVINRQTSATVIDPVRWTLIGWGFRGSSVVMTVYDENGDVSEAEVTGAYSGSTTPTEMRFGTITSPTGPSPFTLEWDYVGYNTAQYITPPTINVLASSIGYFGVPMA